MLAAPLGPRAISAKFRAGVDATRSVLLGPAFGNDASFVDELRVHGGARLTVDDLAAALEAQIGPTELRPAFEAGRAEAPLRAILWERAHGRRKRFAVIADRLARAMWRTLTMLA